MLRKIKNSFSCFDGQVGDRENEAGIGCAAAIINSVSGAIESDRAQLAQEAEFYRFGGESTMPNIGRGYNSTCSEDSYDEADEDVESVDTDDETSSADIPSWITVDDGKGGIKHIRTRADSIEERKRNDHGARRSIKRTSLQAEHSHSMESSRIDPYVNLKKGKRRKRKKENPDDLTASGYSAAEKTPANTLKLPALLKKELSGRSFFSIEPHHDAHSHSRRIVSKKGIVHTERSHVSKRRRRYLSDFFNTMLDIKWRFVLLTFTLSFFLSWFGFAVIWWIISYLRNDLLPDHLPEPLGKQQELQYVPCVLGIYNFASSFLFSVETQHTIGYGSRQTTERCAEAIFLQSLQSVVGVMINACMVGIIFAKLSRPKKRAQTLMSSKNAVVCMRDGKLCLIYRVGNMRYTSLVECHVRAIFISKRVTEEGEVLPYHQTELKVGVDVKGEEDTMLFLWPTSVIHVIDQDSPFYSMNTSDFLRKRYEVIVLLEGIIEPTGMSIQTRSSYMPNEILWGYRFINLLNYRRISNQYKIDYSAFNKVVKVDTPKCSAKQLEEQSVGEDSDLSPQRSPTVVTVLPTPTSYYSSSPIDLKAKFFQSNTIIPYHQSQAALTPPFSNSPFRGAVGGTGDMVLHSQELTSNQASVVAAEQTDSKLISNHAGYVSHVSMPCLQQVKLADSKPNLQAAISAQYKKALGKW